MENLNHIVYNNYEASLTRDSCRKMLYALHCTYIPRRRFVGFNAIAAAKSHGNATNCRATPSSKPPLYYFYPILLSISIRLSIHLFRALPQARSFTSISLFQILLRFSRITLRKYFPLFDIGNMDIDRKQRTELDCNFIERPGRIYIKMADCRLLNDPPQILVMEYSWAGIKVCRQIGWRTLRVQPCFLLLPQIPRPLPFFHFSVSFSFFSSLNLHNGLWQVH